MALIALALSLPASATAAPVPLAQVGSSGSGAGQLNTPRGVALDGAGNLYVVDFLNHRISVFGAGGTFIRAFGWDVAEPDGDLALEVCPTQGACRAGDSGGGAGQLSFPVGVALDDADNLYVADQVNNRISVFGTAGTFIRAFGWDVAEPDGDLALEVCPTQGACRAGDPGDGGGQLQNPTGVALDGAGGLYVADQSNARISVFGIAGPSFTRAFGWDVAEPDGDEAFEVCPTQGACREGDSGGGGGQLASPEGIALDGAGGLYVADKDNHRISVFGTAGPSFTRAFGRDVAEPDGDAAFEVCPTQGACQAGESGSGAGELDSPRGVALDGAGGLYVAEQGTQRISVFSTAGPSFTSAFGWDVADPDGNAAFEVCPTLGTCRAGDSGAGVGQFNSPQGVAMDCRGAAWVLDGGNGRLQRFGEPGTALAPCPPPPAVNPTPPPSSTKKCKKGQKLKKGKCVKKKKKKRKKK